jgi:hypothetical protein
MTVPHRRKRMHLALQAPTLWWATAPAEYCLHLHVRLLVAWRLVKRIGLTAKSRRWIEIDACLARMLHCSRTTGAPNMHINHQRQSHHCSPLGITHQCKTSAALCVGAHTAARNHKEHVENMLGGQAGDRGGSGWRHHHPPGCWLIQCCRRAACSVRARVS